MISNHYSLFIITYTMIIYLTFTIKAVMISNSGLPLFTMLSNYLWYSKQSIIHQAGGITSAGKLIVACLALTTSTFIYLGLGLLFILL